MGIQGLLKLLKPITKESHISEYKGKRACVDIMGWIYKGTYSCAYDILVGNYTTLFIQYSIKMIKLLEQYQITPVFVFDGLSLPAKKICQQARKDKRSKNIQEGIQLMNTENPDDKKKAHKLFGGSVELNSEIIFLVMDVVERMGFQYFCAPYDADAQISFLCKEGFCDFAISEDSDLLVYGCPEVVFKLGVDGKCTTVKIDMLWNSNYISMIDDKWIKQLHKNSRLTFVQLCVMAGTDYLSNIKGFGLKVGLKMLQHVDDVPQLVAKLRVNKTFKMNVPDNYLQALFKIQLIFLYGKVIHPITYQLHNISPIPQDLIPEEKANPKKPVHPTIWRKKDFSILGTEFDSLTTTKIKHYLTGRYDIRKGQKRTPKSEEQLDQIIQKYLGNLYKPAATPTKTHFDPEYNKILKEVQGKIKQKMKESAKKDSQSKEKQSEPHIQEDDITGLEDYDNDEQIMEYLRKQDQISDQEDYQINEQQLREVDDEIELLKKMCQDLDSEGLANVKSSLRKPLHEISEFPEYSKEKMESLDENLIITNPCNKPSTRKKIGNTQKLSEPNEYQTPKLKKIKTSQSTTKMEDSQDKTKLNPFKKSVIKTKTPKICLTQTPSNSQSTKKSTPRSKRKRQKSQNAAPLTIDKYFSSLDEEFSKPAKKKKPEKSKK